MMGAAARGLRAEGRLERHSSVATVELAAAAQSLLAVRGSLRAALPGGFMYDPVFDILLILYVAEAEHRALRQEDVCRGACAAPNSTRQWIKALIDEQFIEERGSCYGLTDRGLAALEQALGHGAARRERVNSGT